MTLQTHTNTVPFTIDSAALITKPFLSLSLSLSNNGFPIACFLCFFYLKSKTIMRNVRNRNTELSRSNMGFWLLSSFLRHLLCFFSCGRSYLPLRFLLCQFLHLYLSWKRRRCLGRNLCLNCYPVQFLHQSFRGFLFSPSSSFSFFADLCFLFVFSFRLNHEAKHFDLSRSYHSFMFSW